MVAGIVPARKKKETEMEKAAREEYAEVQKLRVRIDAAIQASFSREGD